jgi:hypothetical protein
MVHDAVMLGAKTMGDEGKVEADRRIKEMLGLARCSCASAFDMKGT